MAKKKSRGKKKRKASPAQLAALAKGRATTAARRRGRKKPGSHKRRRAKKATLTSRPRRASVVHMRTSARRRRRRSHAMVVGGHRKARHAARSVARTVGQEKHRTGAFIVAAGLGLAKAKGYEIPHVATIGEAGTIAVAAWAARKFAGVRSPWVDHIATGAGVIAIYEAVASGNIPLLGKKKTEGDDIDGAYET